jgi:hypothetical protein
MLSSYVNHLAQMQQAAFRNLSAQQNALMQQQSLAGLGMFAGMSAYSPTPTPIYDQMKCDLNKWLEDWDK